MAVELAVLPLVVLDMADLVVYEHLVHPRQSAVDPAPVVLV